MSQEPTAASSISRLEARLSRMHQDALLTRQRDRLGETEALLARLPLQLGQLRSRGYFYRGHLETQTQRLVSRWPALRGQASAEIERQVAELRPAIDRADDVVRRLQPLKARPLSTAQPSIRRAEDELAAVERRISAAQQAVEAMVGALASEAQALAREVLACERMLDWLAGATFTLEAGESLVAATEARLIEGTIQQQGLLFLTDRRLLFERRERVARKKVLFVTTATEEVRELRWQASLQELERVDASEARRALARRRELLTVEPQSGALELRADLELGADSDMWRALILRCQTGEIAAERAGGAPEVPEYIVPARCSSCGGALRQAGRIRGVSLIRCDYCGVAIPLERA